MTSQGTPTPASTPNAEGNTLSQSRDSLVQSTIERIRQIHRDDGITRESLASTAKILEELAENKALFSLELYPPPASGEGSHRFELYTQPDQSYALYLNVQHPGKNSVPHDHKTWAVITAVQGQEINRIYRRTDDGADPQYAKLELEREVLVEVGTSVAYLGDDIHSIHVQGNQPTLHFHLYGRALETLTERVAFDLETGAVRPYNQSFWKPNAG
ncbi:cysteine dioxygenase family protein [Ottowia thiooxydans]|uniref:cysteine dioxygenase family protein n=1 Tax=Ottowia thiooxydans TaxID=219182 RepID=UPI0004214C05|nr:cysteine dioxygenase family protein [Ottowia thiooxydans]